MENRKVRFSLEDGVATVTLARPEAANALDVATATELYEAAQRCDDDEVRAVLLRADGPIFCAGGDVKAFGEAGDALPELLARILTPLHGAIARFAQMDAPLVVAIGGTAAGGGLSLACCGDFVLAADTARFTIAYTRIGMTPDGSSSYFLPRRIGMSRTKEMMLRNPLLDAATALEWGLIDRVVPAADLETEAAKLAAELAKGPTLAFGGVKRLLLDSLINDLETQLELEARSICEMGATDDGKEGIRAFLEKRSPRFRGARQGGNSR